MGCRILNRMIKTLLGCYWALFSWILELKSEYLIECQVAALFLWIACKGHSLLVKNA